MISPLLRIHFATDARYLSCAAITPVKSARHASQLSPHATTPPFTTPFSIAVTARALYAANILLQYHAWAATAASRRRDSRHQLESH